MEESIWTRNMETMSPALMRYNFSPVMYCDSLSGVASSSSPCGGVLRKPSSSLTDSTLLSFDGSDCDDITRTELNVL